MDSLSLIQRAVLVLIVPLIGAQLVLCAPQSIITPSADNNTADLSPLINETLNINNKTLPTEANASGSIQSDSPSNSFKDDWTFDMVEYDLIDFLRDLSARYKLVNESKPISERVDSDLLDGKSDLNNKTETTTTTTTTAPGTQDANKETNPTINRTTQQAPTPAPILSTSLASGDHEIAESSWQYGIFDRFTRPKTTSTTAEPASHSSSSSNFDVRSFNSDECGLRNYEEEVHYYPDQQSELDGATKELNQRRQRPPSFGGLFGPSRKQQASLSQSDLKDELDQINEKKAYESYADKNDSNEQEMPPNVDDNAADSEFNLNARRQWLQQQLGNTLQMLGFNASSMSAAEYLNQTSGLSLNMRENMMKKSKFGKSLYDDEHKPDPSQPEVTEQELKARQDELKLEARVIGGSDAMLGDSPWSVSLQALVSRPGTGGVEYRHYCGGTIISEYYILTAAHCLDFMVGRESRLFVVIGDLNWRMSAASMYGRRLGIEKLIIHSGYKSTAFGHDIGLIRVKEPIRPLRVNGRYIVNSVCLPEKNVEHSGEAELVGWGLFSNRNEMADALQIADVPILPRPLCVDLYKRRTGLIQWLIGIELITDKQVCAGTFGRGICQGDSGSALVYNEKVPTRSRPVSGKAVRRKSTVRDHQLRATIIGTVAFGGIRRCSYQSLPGVYMQTSKYLDWILPRVQA